MTYQQAIKLATEALEKEIERLAVDANLHEKLGADYPHAIRAAKRRKKLRVAIELLNKPQVSQLNSVTHSDDKAQLL